MLKLEECLVITFVIAKPSPEDNASHSALLFGKGNAPSCQNEFAQQGSETIQANKNKLKKAIDAGVDAYREEKTKKS